MMSIQILHSSKFIFNALYLIQNKNQLLMRPTDFCNLAVTFAWKKIEYEWDSLLIHVYNVYFIC
jgi:hypothetical protein